MRTEAPFLPDQTIRLESDFHAVLGSMAKDQAGQDWRPAHLTDASRIVGNGRPLKWDAVYVQLNHGMSVSFGQYETEAGYRCTTRADGCLIVTVMSAGKLYCLAPEETTLESGQCLVRLQQRGETYSCLIPGQQHVASVRLTIDPEILCRDFHMPGGAAWLRQRLAFRKFDLNADARRTAALFYEEHIDRPTATLRLEILALDLLRAVIDQLCESSEAEIHVASGTLPPREERQVVAARRLIELHFDDVPTVTVLARRVGTNATKLTRNFKLAFGETIAAFALRLRMERARDLLLHERLGVGEVAYRVGYQHHSSFTAAFRSFYGVSPKAASSVH
ncbi:hypothetical protein GCM10027034_37570 [Ramlibacter solisilvae]|uniref:helix-turn-helix transcriptional regulator n=1 Tax=Ramlibacter tataouinensis TaxID=94132 RepID=UPI0007780217|nr:AraC family transcriptional regulator [Ramlibacter tataouinensis]